MTTISSERAGGRPRWIARLDIREMWASLAIVAIWLAVLFDGVFGPDIVTNANSVGGSAGTRVPSAVVVAFFAFLATWVVARYGFRRGGERGR